MILPAHLNFFSIDECGLYKHGQKTSKGINPEETFELIYEWVKGRPMEDTIPWDSQNARNGLSKCYCHDYFRCEKTGDYLFVLWKSDADSVGTILGAVANDVTGQAKVVAHTDNYKGGKVIWGRPCYYWIIPKIKTIVSIKMDHSVCDSNLFQEWVEKCITNKIQHPFKKKSVTAAGHIRFEFTDGSEFGDGRFSYRFTVHLRSLSTGSAKLQELAPRVTHIIRRDTIKVGTGIDERPVWVQFFDKVPLVPTKPKAKTRQIEVRAEAKPSANEIKEIIEKFAREERKSRDWNNVGFATDNGDVWVDKYRLHESLSLNMKDSTIFSASEMHIKLDAHRERLLSAIEHQERGVKLSAASGGKR